jgi:hypothetical protein
MSEQEQRLYGPDLLIADVFGDSVPALKTAALDQARELYGEDAELAVERVGTIKTSAFPGRGKFETWVRVRCLNFPGKAP